MINVMMTILIYNGNTVHNHNENNYTSCPKDMGVKRLPSFHQQFMQTAAPDEHVLQSRLEAKLLRLNQHATLYDITL